MNFSSMEYFIALAEERSFTRAAQRLMVTQQTLSAHIAGVERELGVRLVNRKVPLTLTYAGEVLLGYARRFETDRRAMEQEFADIAGDVQGLLAVGIASTRGRLLMPRAIAAFREQKPGVRVLIDEEENEELIEALREGRVDMAVATVPPSVPGLEVRLLRSERAARSCSLAGMTSLATCHAPSSSNRGWIGRPRSSHPTRRPSSSLRCVTSGRPSCRSTSRRRWWATAAGEGCA